MLRLGTVLLLVCFALPFAASAVEWEVDRLEIESSDGNRHVFNIELAVTPEQRAQGLMHRESLAEDWGMLFLHRRDQVLSMWMRNTLIPLDMLFIDRRGRIVRIAERTTPMSERAITSGRPARAVLEVPGGTVERLGISKGDRVIYSAFE